MKGRKAGRKAGRHAGRKKERNRTRWTQSKRGETTRKQGWGGVEGWKERERKKTCKMEGRKVRGKPRKEGGQENSKGRKANRKEKQREKEYHLKKGKKKVTIYVRFKSV